MRIFALLIFSLFSSNLLAAPNDRDQICVATTTQTDSGFTTDPIAGTYTYDGLNVRFIKGRLEIQYNGGQWDMKGSDIGGTHKYLSNAVADSVVGLVLYHKK